MLLLIQIFRKWLSRKLDGVAYLTAENLALRQQLIELKRKHNRPQLKERDRLFWKVLGYNRQTPRENKKQKLVISEESQR